MNYLQEVGKRIADRRKQLGITQDALATAVGYTSRSSINKIEKGLVNLPQSKVSEIASVLLVDPAYIMGWETETKPKIKFNMRLFDGRAEEETEKEKKLLALYDKIEDKEGLIRFIERLSALSAEQQKFVFDNLLQGQ